MTLHRISGGCWGLPYAAISASIPSEASRTKKVSGSRGNITFKAQPGFSLSATSRARTMLLALTSNVVGLAVPRSTSIQTLIIWVLHLPATCFMPLLHLFCYISATAAQNIGNSGYVQGAGLDQTHQKPQADHRIRLPSLHVAVLWCNAEACLDSIERRTV